MKIRCEYTKLCDPKALKPHPKNRNKHSKEQVERLCKILTYQGWRYPIKVSNVSGFITSGHGRLMAALKLGLKEVPVSFQDYESDDQEYADVQSDNAIASWAELDFSGINLDIADLGPDFDIDLLGIKDFKIDVSEKDSIEDEVPEQVEAKTKLGDLYLLGDHRLLCGDSTQIESVEKLMGGEKADITFTSPPYNLGDNAKLRGYNGDGKDSAYNEKTDHKTQAEYLSFLGIWTQLAIKNSRYVFSNIQILAGNKFIMSDYWQAFKSNLVDIMIWDKEHAQPAAALRVLNSVWEFIFIFTDEHEPKRSIKIGPEFRGNIYNIFRLNPNKGPKDKEPTHGAVFPVAFAEHFISNFSDKSVLDLFGGSGSTLIACEKTKRKCFMMELDPHYCDIIVARWEKYSGGNAELVKCEDNVKNG